MVLNYFFQYNSQQVLKEGRKLEQSVCNGVQWKETMSGILGLYYLLNTNAMTGKMDCSQEGNIREKAG